MKTLLAILIGAAALAFAAIHPAAAQEGSGLKCLVLDNTNRSVVYDVCKCQIVRNVPIQTKNLLRPDPIKVALRCPFINEGGGGGVAEIPSETPERGHGFSFSKAESSSGVASIAIGGSTPIAITILGEHTSSVALGNGGASAGAGSSGGSAATGSPTVTLRVEGPTGSSSTSNSWGSTGGGSCAGSGCGGGGSSDPN